LHTLVTFWTPWEFSPTVLLASLACAALYLRGWLRTPPRERPGPWRTLGFFAGLGASYAFLQTRLDYWAQHMFWIHRMQHLVLHHAAPFVIALSAPVATLAQGTPRWLMRGVVAPLLHNRALRLVYRTIQNPVVASLLFTGLIVFWLTPSIHFMAMLSLARYDAMNWSMLIDGLLFWWLIVGPEQRGEFGPPGFGTRMLMLWAVMLPQIAIGAYIALHATVLYDVYSVCGRAWPISPLTDQNIGGLITWVPAAMMSAVGALVVMRRWLGSRDPDAADALAP
jgi:putative membrane protein